MERFKLLPQILAEECLYRDAEVWVGGADLRRERYRYYQQRAASLMKDVDLEGLTQEEAEAKLLHLLVEQEGLATEDMVGLYPHRD